MCCVGLPWRMDVRKVRGGHVFGCVRVEEVISSIPYTNYASAHNVLLLLLFSSPSPFIIHLLCFPYYSLSKDCGFMF